MLYFIPAWYNGNDWCESEQIWYVRRMQKEFDDTVKQIQLFHRNELYPYQILVLGFVPNFRHFLHRQGVFRAPYWSCFDAIQEVHSKRVRTFSYHDLNWPDKTEFVYTPFSIVALLNGEKYAKVEFGESGNPIQIDLYRENQIYRRNLYDDRGFVSATDVYVDGQPVYRDYLMENGIWKMRQFMNDGHIEINPDYPKYLLVCKGGEIRRAFLKRSYQSMEQVIGEVLRSYMVWTDREDIFCIAMHPLHTRLLMDTIKRRRYILSFFGDRYDPKEYPEELKLLEGADYLVTDSVDTTARIIRYVKIQNNRIVNITPFDTRMEMGISQQLSVQKILLPVDDIGQEQFGELIAVLGKYLEMNDKAEICLFTRQTEYNRKSTLLQHARYYLKRNGYPEGWAAEEGERQQSENAVEVEEPVKVRFTAEQCTDELAISRCMREQRILLDLQKEPELYLQILALSFGMPQILAKGNQFMIDGRNGTVLKDIQTLPEVLDYYLGSLEKWNIAQMYAYEIGKRYTTRVLLTKWKEVIDIVG